MREYASCGRDRVGTGSCRRSDRSRPLATVLDVGHGARMRIDWTDLEAAFSFSSTMHQHFLLFQTGEVLLLSADIDDEERAEMEKRLAAGGFAEIEAPDSHEQWDWMAAFAETVQDQRLRELLEEALAGKGAFRRFKDVLLSIPDERERWFRFEAQAMHAAIDRWVTGLAIEIENLPPWAEARTPAVGPDTTAQPSVETSIA